jgi:hypothetical protein
VEEALLVEDVKLIEMWVVAVTAPKDHQKNAFY